MFGEQNSKCDSYENIDTILMYPFIKLQQGGNLIITLSEVNLFFVRTQMQRTETGSSE